MFSSARQFCAAGLLSLALSAASYAGSLDFACPANNGSTSNGSQCNDVITSLGIAVIRITDPNVIAALAGSPPPGYDPGTHLFVTPLMFDQNTIIGRSSPFAGGSVSDTGGVPIGVTNGGVTQIAGTGDPGTFPSGFPSGNNDEIHTAILSLNLVGGGGFGVQAGSAITNGVNVGVSSLGEVESIGCNSIATSSTVGSCPGGSDFPANSFFDVFADIVTPFGTFSNTSALVVQNSSITALPPTVVYTHGQSSSVPIYADAPNGFGEVQGDQFGTMILTGHGAGFSPSGSSSGGVAPDTNNAKAFGTQMETIIANDSGLSSADRSFLASQVSSETGASAPEPSTWLLLAAGIGALGFSKHRRVR